MAKKNEKYVIGVDIGGTNMKAILFDGKNAIADYSLATPKDNLDHFMVMLGALIDPLKDQAHKNKKNISGIGIGVNGPVDVKNNIVSACPNNPVLAEIKLAALIEEKIGIQTKLDNDGNCFLRAEVKRGAAREYKNVYGITLGTSIGSAWWFNNEIYLGAHGESGELPHTIMDFEKGEEIKLETLYQELTNKKPKDLAIRAFQGDTMAEDAFEKLGNLLGDALANVVNLLDPEAIVIGGGVMQSSELFFGVLEKKMREKIIGKQAKKVKILKGKIGKDAGAIGAALLFD